MRKFRAQYAGLLIIAAAVSFSAGCSAKEAAAEPKAAEPAVQETAAEETVEAEAPAEAVESVSAATVDGTTSASVVPEDLIKSYDPKGFTEGDAKKALFILGDPRKNSVLYDMAYRAMEQFETNGVEVELRDLYDLEFNPVLQRGEFYYAKDGSGEPSQDVKIEQEFVAAADYIIFVYPNWHDTPNAITKGYMERVFAKKFAYQDTESGLHGMLEGKAFYTIMNAGFLGGGRGTIGDGVGIDNEAWDRYGEAFKVLDDDTSGFWAMDNYGRFINDRSPKNGSETYQEDLEALRTALEDHLNKVFFNK